MNPQETFDTWKIRKSQIDLGQHFADRVMAGIRRKEAAKAARIWRPLLSYVTAHPRARAAVLIAGTLLGVARIAVTIHLVLFA